MLRAEKLEELAPDSELGHYRIIEHIAEGGMGHVFRAWEPSLNREVAIKVLKEEFMDNPQHLEAFAAEAQNIAALRHANIVPVYFVGSQGELHYFVMPFIEGSTLDDWIEAGVPMNVEQADWVMRQATDALDWALNNGIVHLDIKPSNFLVDHSGGILLTDFGLAKTLSGGEEESRECFGTPAYISPEQIMNQQTDQRSDIYSLGATVYHLMTMRFLYDSESVEEIVLAHLESPFPRREAELTGIPPGWINLFEHMVQKKPEDRYQDYQELRAALDNVDRLAPVNVGFEEEDESSMIPVPIRGENNPQYIHGLLGHRYESWTTAVVESGIEQSKKQVVEAIHSGKKPLEIHSLAKPLKEVFEASDGEIDDMLAAMELLPEVREFIQYFVNCGFYGQEEILADRKVVRTLGESVVYKLIVLGVTLRDDVKVHGNEFNWFCLWQHSIGVALVSHALLQFMESYGKAGPGAKKSITSAVSLGRMMSAKTWSRAFFAGLVHDVGKFVLAEIAPYPYYGALRLAQERMVPLHEVEEEVFGITHMEMGSLWLHKHGFDSAVRTAVLEHGDLDKVSSPLSATVAVANQIVKRQGVSFSGSPVVEYRDVWGTKAWEELKKFAKNDAVTPEVLEREFIPAVSQMPWFVIPAKASRDRDMA